MSASRVLIVGGAGVFGFRLAEGLAVASDVEIFIAGRSLARAQRAVANLGRGEAIELDREQVTADILRALQPSIVIDAAGPFQQAGLGLARAALGAGAHYLDLADARDFVAKFPQLDALAKAGGRVALTGASSTPAITHAALDALCADWARVDCVRAGIAPGHRIPRGHALVEGILRWAGAPVRVFADGAWRERTGWSHAGNFTVDGVGRRRFALAETPDLDLIPARFAPHDEALFMAGLEIGIVHRGIEAIGWLRHAGIWPHPQRAAVVLRFAADLLAPFGGDRGGMFVEVLGRDARDQPAHARWTLVAPAGKGPYTPTLPALALTRRLIAGAPIAPGARACVGVLSLADLESDFARLGFTTQIETRAVRAPFDRALGKAFAEAPPAVIAGHRSGPVTRLSGEARVEGAATPLGALVARCVGFPKAAAGAPVRVIKRLEADGSESWTRRIGDSGFKSRLCFVRPGVVREHFGPFAFDMALWLHEGQLRMRVIGWRLGLVPLAALLAPQAQAFEADQDGRFHFDVLISAPLIGRIVRYSGYLSLEALEAEAPRVENARA